MDVWFEIRLVLSPIEIVLRRRDEVYPLINPLLDEIEVQNEGMSGQ